MGSQYQAIDGQCPNCNSRDVYDDPNTDKIYCKGCDTLFKYTEFHGEEGSAASGDDGDSGDGGIPTLNRD